MDNELEIINVLDTYSPVGLSVVFVEKLYTSILNKELNKL
jgi:hypothetical protein